jgi:hypothetical protein
MKREIKEMIWRETVWHRPFEIRAVWELLAHLAAATPRGAVIWETRGCEGRTRYLLGADRKYIGGIEETMKAHGDIRFYEMTEPRKPADATRQLKITHPVLSLNTDISASVIRAGLAAMAAGRGKDETVLQVVLGGAYAPSAVPAKMPDPNASWLAAVLGNVGRASPESRAGAKEKAGQHGFCAVIRAGASGYGAAGRISGLHSALKTLESAGVRLYTECEKPERLDTAHVPWHFPLRLSAKELANFLLLPAGEEELVGAEGLHPKRLLPPAWYKDPAGTKDDRTFALGADSAQRRRLSISARDALEHTIILGPTGSGKSTAMLRLILADIREGRSVLVIDPKADLVNDILERIPEERADETAVIDPSDPCPVGFNPFAFKTYKNKTLIADAVLAALKEIFAENWGIRSQDILSGALLTLAETKGASLLWLPALLTDETFRKKVTSKLTDRIGLIPFWEHYEAMRDSERRQEIAPVMNKIRQFLFRPGLRNVLGQSEPKFNLTDMFYHRRIVLVPLNRGVIGAESARLLGSLIVGLTWTLALSRANLPPEKRHIVSVFIDELQDYLSLPTDLSDALAQARGLGMALTLAHQYREQLPPEIRAGVDANARNKIIFGLNNADAKDMAAMAPELTARDFTALPRYEIYTSFHQDGRNTGWIRGQTLPAPPAVRQAAELRAQSMTTYGRPAEETEAEYLKTLITDAAPDENLPDAPVGRRKKP